MQPGGDNHITVADVRLAILIETLFEESFSTSESTWEAPLFDPQSTPPTVAAIEREWKRYAQIRKEREIEKHNSRKEGVVKPLGSGRFPIAE